MGFRLSAVNLAIGHNCNTVAGNISFGIGPAECIMLCGPNGAGKTTLMGTLAGAIPAVSGTICTDAPAVLVPSRIPKVKGFTVKEFIKTALSSHTDWSGRLPGRFERRMEYALELVGIGPLSERDISTLSDGEFQKACVASAVVRDAGLIMLDEPTAFLDVDSRAAVLRALRDITSEGLSVLFSSHDILDAVNCVTRVFGLASGGVFLDSGKNAGKESRLKILSSCFESVSP
ncbi:MAG: ABC transporter ATP-binding protein [Candidatus Cryptobacteroides sp.]|nr:ABC transporter ATP-binding protein [Bacteroidales bacterium]